jgi:hypothetical protein
LRHSLRGATAVLVCAFLVTPTLAPPARAAEDSFIVTLGKAAGGSAAGKGGEFAVKLVGGLIYDSSCNAPVMAAGTRYICDILGSVTGKAEEQWKANVEKRLQEISNQLDVLTRGQDAIARELTQMHKAMELEFEQAAQKVVATHAIVTIEGLWKKYEAEFRPGSPVSRDEMVEFATNIIHQKLDVALQNLNVALTTRVLEGQPMLRYPLYKWRETKGFTHFRFEGQEVYDFAEKKFVEYRTHQEKAYLMYLWAATVLESRCKLKPAECRTKPPVSTEVFKRDFERYTVEQVKVFDAAVDWLLLSYGNPHSAGPRFLLPDRWEETVARANFLTNSLLAPGGKGMWGRVVAMGDAWDGSLQLKCGGKTQTVKPAFSYTVPAEGNIRFWGGYNKDYGPTDWWGSSKGNAIYDEVHFADQWKIFHYSLPDAPVGACAAVEQLPGRGVLPWAQSGTEVLQVKTADGRSLPFGSFIAVQRAGGTYALLSGATWKADQKNPTHVDNPPQGKLRPTLGTIKYSANASLVETTGHDAGPWIGVLSAGRGEFTASLQGNSRVEIKDSIRLWMDKPISFPDSPGAVLNLASGTDCKNLCRPSTDDGLSLFRYDIENNDTEAKKGDLTAWLGAYLSKAHQGSRQEATGQGILIDRSYKNKGSRESVNVKDLTQSGTVTTAPGNRYYLNMVVDFDVITEGRGLDATTWMYQGKLMPQSLFVSKK